jgi:hypothetical protein
VEYQGVKNEGHTYADSQPKTQQQQQDGKKYDKENPNVECFCLDVSQIDTRVLDAIKKYRVEVVPAKK